MESSLHQSHTDKKGVAVSKKVLPSVQATINADLDRLPIDDKVRKISTWMFPATVRYLMQSFRLSRGEATEGLKVWLDLKEKHNAELQADCENYIAVLDGVPNANGLFLDKDGKRSARILAEMNNKYGVDNVRKKIDEIFSERRK